MAIDKISNKRESFLIFSVLNSLFAIRSSAVVELIWLPELSRIESNSFYVVGYFNFRSEFVPVIDLNLRQGLKTKRYRAQDRVLVISQNSKKFGIHINDVHNVIHLNYEKDNSFEENHTSKITEGVIQTQFGITQILKEYVLMDSNFSEKESLELKEFSEIHLAKLFGGITAAEREILITRKNSYSKSATVKEYSNLLSVVVLRLKDEYLAIELKYILEFAHGEGITRIPCVPAHITGCINLRGDLLVLIDLHFILKGNKTESFENMKIVVIKYNEMMIGFIVDELIDVIYLSKESILMNPTDSNAKEQGLMKGVCFHQSLMVGLVDLDKVFAYEKLYVEEFVSN